MTPPSPPSAAPHLPATLQMALARTLQRTGEAQGRPELTQRAGELAALGWTPGKHRKQAKALLEQSRQLMASSPAEAETLLAQAATHEQLAKLQEALKLKPLR